MLAFFCLGACYRPWRYFAALHFRVSIRGKFCAPCIRKRAPFGKICAPCIRKAPQTAVWERTARRSCHEGAAFAARAPRIMHGAQMLPSAVVPNRPSARNPGAAEQREPPELDRPAQETQPGGSIPVATAPPIRQPTLAQREGYLPCLRRLSSVLLADAIGL